jgi:hypothetical protein
VTVRLLRNIFAGLAAGFVLAAVVSFVVNLDRVDTTTPALGIIAFGLGVVGMLLAMTIRRRGQ